MLPAPGDVFRALALTPLDAVRAVILGQDPYPTPGDAHGLAFSYVGKRRLPASLKVILAEMAEETGSAVPTSGDLTPWARQGVLLLNAALTVEAGASGAHMKLGWDALTDGAVTAVSETRPAVAFLLWGAPPGAAPPSSTGRATSCWRPAIPRRSTAGPISAARGRSGRRMPGSPRRGSSRSTGAWPKADFAKVVAVFATKIRDKSRI